jgi:inner membrane protein CreD
MRRLLAIGVIWLGCSLAWAALGSTLLARSSTSFDGLGSSVRALWGPPLQQQAPSAAWTEVRQVVSREHRADDKGRPVLVESTEAVETQRPVPLERTDLDVALSLRHRQKGLLWFATYDVSLAGRYAFRNDTAEPRELRVRFPLEQDGVVYDAFAVTAEDGSPVEVAFEEGAATFSRRVGPGQPLAFGVAYRSRGTERWGYGKEGAGLGPEAGRARNVRIAVQTDFSGVDFPDGALSPSKHRPADQGWRGEWRFDQLVGTKAVAVTLPQRLNPGPLAARLTLFAPIGLLFFFFVVAVLLAARQRSIHPMNYLLLGCAFFAFHLLFAYLIDHVEIAPAFAVASLVSVGLAVSYARLFLGTGAALRLVGVPQLLYLVLFSVTFFWAGFTGLAVTVGAIVTLFVIMQITGKTDWAAAFERRPGAEAPPPLPAR